MSSGGVNKYVEDLLTDSFHKPDRKALYYSEANMAEFDNGSCCSTTAQNSSELSLETNNSTSKVTTSAAVVSEDEFDGNVYDALVKSGEMGYNKNEFNISTNLDENLYDFEQNNLNVTNNFSKGSRLNFNKNTRNTYRTKSRNTLDSSTTLDKSTTIQEQLKESQQLEKSRNMDYDLDKDQEDKFNLSELTKNKTADAVNVTNYTDRPTTKVVGDVYFFLLQMKLLNTLDLVRSVCKPWGVPPFGNDYVFHFDQIVNSTVLALLHRYEEIFTPIYSKFSSGNPKLLWTKVEDVDYFKIVYQLECLRFKQPFVSTIYDNILRYTVTKLDNSESTNLLESLHGNYMDNNNKWNIVCSFCGNLYKDNECKYCVDSLENSPTRKTIINQVNLEEDNHSITSTVDSNYVQDLCQLSGYVDYKDENKNLVNKDKPKEDTELYVSNEEGGNNDTGESTKELNRDEVMRMEDELLDETDRDSKYKEETPRCKHDKDEETEDNTLSMSKVDVDSETTGFDMSMLKGVVGGLKFDKSSGIGYSKDYSRNLSNLSKKSKKYFEKYNGAGYKNNQDLDLVDEWPGDLKQVDSDNPFTLTNLMDVRNEDDFYSLFNEDISSSFVCSPGSGSIKSTDDTNKANEPGSKVDPGVLPSGSKENIVDQFTNTVDLDKVVELREGLMEEVDLTSTNSITSSNNNTRLISTDNVDNSEVDVTTNSNVDFSENFMDNTKFQTDGNNGISHEKSKFDESFVDQDNSYAILDENILSTINEELLNISDEDILEEQYFNKGNQDIEKIILSVLNRKLTAHFNKYQDNKYNEYVENAGYLSSLYPNYPYSTQPVIPQVTNKYNNPKFTTSKYKNNYLSTYMDDSYRNIDKYAYVENKYAHMENRYNYIEYPNNTAGSREKKRVKLNRDPDYQYPYSSYKDLYKDTYKTYNINKDKPKDRFRDDKEKKRKRRLNSDSMSSNISNHSDSYGNGYGSYKDRDKEIKISSHVVSASVSYDKRQQRFMAQWKTKEGTKHSKSFYAKRYATPIMARKHAELYKMYILQHRVMNANDLVEPTYEQLLANNFKDLDAVNVGELDYEL